MKLLIDNPITYTETLSPSTTEEEYNNLQEYLDGVKSLLVKFGIDHSIVSKESYFSVSIEAQKVCLDEWQMSEFFSEVLNEFDFKYTLRRASYGTGCDFTLILDTAQNTL